MISVPLDLIRPRSDVLSKKLGLKDPAQVELLKSLIDELLLGRDARFWFKKVAPDALVLKELFLSSVDLSNALKGFSDIFAVICTIGPVPMKKDMIQGLYLDRASSDLCENLAAYSAKLILTRFYNDEKYELSKRFSPGYGDLRLERQKDLFSVFGNEDIGVRLSDSFYMEPEKSISYLVGVREK